MVFDPAKFEDGTYVYWSLNMGQFRQLGAGSPFCRTHSYYMHFNRTPGAGAFFAKAREIYRELMSEPIVATVSARWVPDEIAFTLATAEVDATVYAGYNMPIAERILCLDGPTSLDVLRDEFVGLTMIGQDIPDSLVTVYNSTVSQCAVVRRVNAPHLWKYVKAESVSTDLSMFP
jgi:hypothetical protein